MTIIGRERPRQDRDFLDIFMPYEIRVAQRRAMAMDTAEGMSGRCLLGLYLVHLEPTSPDGALASSSWGALNAHVHQLVIAAIRDSDIPCFLGDGEHFAVARDLDAENAFVIAQRMLGSVTRSKVLATADVRISVGFVVYPLSNQPNLPPSEWSILLDLTRALSARDRPKARTSGYGLVQGTDPSASRMAENVLIPVAIDDPNSMIEAGALKLQQIRVLSGI